MHPVKILPDSAGLAWAAAEYIVQLAGSAVYEHQQFTFALSGGSTPRRLYELLAAPGFSGQIAWQYVHIFWSDERCVPPDHPDSNYRMVREVLLDHVPIPAANVHRMAGELNPPIAAAEYEQDLRAYFAEQQMPHFDLILLGMGDDGHTASLFPGTAVLQEQSRWVVANHVEAKQSWRITLTLPAINAADHVIFLVSGSSKAETMREVLSVPGSNLPAQFVQPGQGELVWLVDEAAANLLML